VLHQLVQGFDAEVPLRDPADHLDVPQAAGGPLHIRLKLVGGVVVAMVACQLLLALLGEELG
jgi:hypothetical protein